jgi:hypothetical protein
MTDSGYTVYMTEHADAWRGPGVPPPTDSRDPESHPWDDVLGRLPSKEEVVKSARSVDEIVAEQPSVDELLGRNRNY